MTSGFHVTRQLSIGWGDCDPAGIVFYPRYFAMFDASTWGLLSTALVCDEDELCGSFGIVGFPMVDTRATFHAPLRYGDRVGVISSVETMKRSSFTVLHELRKEDGTLAVTGWETRVWATTRSDDLGGLIGIPIPDVVRGALLGPTQRIEP